MTRRAWLLPVGALLCCALVSACAHNSNRQVDEVSIDLLKGETSKEAKKQETKSAGSSPYQAVSTNKVAKRAEPVLPVSEPSKAPSTSEVKPAGVTDSSPGPNPPSVALGMPTDIEEENTAPEPIKVTEAKLAPESPLVAAMQCFLDKRPAEAVTRLDKYEKDNQELLLCLLPLATFLTEGSLHQANPQSVDAMLDQLDNISMQLRSRGSLAIDRMCFCRRIESFGIFEPQPDDHQFRPGDWVQIYVELRNFKSEKTSQGSFVTRLASKAEIRDNAGKKIWPPEPGERIQFRRKRPQDESRAQRHDYFDNYHFVVPDIPPGSYSLWIEVEDQGTNPPRVAKRSLDFHITNLHVRGS